MLKRERFGPLLIHKPLDPIPPSPPPGGVASAHHRPDVQCPQASQHSSLRTVAAAGPVTTPHSLPPSDRSIATTAADSVTLPRHVGLLLLALRRDLRDEQQPAIYVSDRRLVKATHLLRVAAGVQGRARVSLVDCLLLQHMFWWDPEDYARVREWLWDNLVPDGGVGQCQFLLDSLVERAGEAAAADKKVWASGQGCIGREGASEAAPEVVR